MRDYLFYGGPLHQKIRTTSGEARFRWGATYKINWKDMVAGPNHLYFPKAVTHVYRLTKFYDGQRDEHGEVYVYQGDRPYWDHKVINVARRMGMMQPARLIYKN